MGDLLLVAYGFIRTRRNGFILFNVLLGIERDESVSTGSDKSVSYVGVKMI
jgi:hypothetical protein